MQSLQCLAYSEGRIYLLRFITDRSNLVKAYSAQERRKEKSIRDRERLRERQQEKRRK